MQKLRPAVIGFQPFFPRMIEIEKNIVEVNLCVYL